MLKSISLALMFSAMSCMLYADHPVTPAGAINTTTVADGTLVCDTMPCDTMSCDSTHTACNGGSEATETMSNTQVVFITIIAITIALFIGIWSMRTRFKQ